MIIDTRSDERICYYKGSELLKKVPLEFQGYISKEAAILEGYAIHDDDNLLVRSVNKRRKEIDVLCHENGLSFKVDFDRIKVKSPLGEWFIIVAGKEKNLFLYHKNSPKSPDTASAVPGYHHHKLYSKDIYDHLEAIAKHDNWRMANQIVAPVKPRENSHKQGSSAWKRHEKNEKRRRESRSISATLKLLDAISEQNRRKAMGLA